VACSGAVRFWNSYVGGVLVERRREGVRKADVRVDALPVVLRIAVLDGRRRVEFIPELPYPLHLCQKGTMEGGKNTYSAVIDVCHPLEHRKLLPVI
jgi:hypothetical protein